MYFLARQLSARDYEYMFHLIMQPPHKSGTIKGISSEALMVDTIAVLALVNSQGVFLKKNISHGPLSSHDIYPR